MVLTALVLCACKTAANQTVGELTNESTTLEITHFSVSDEQLKFSIKIKNSLNDPISIPTTFGCYNIVFRLEFFDEGHQAINSNKRWCKFDYTQLDFVEIPSKDFITISYREPNTYGYQSSMAYVKVNLISDEYYTNYHQAKDPSSRLWIGTITSGFFKL